MGRDVSVEIQADTSLRGSSKSWLSTFQRWIPRRLPVAQKVLWTSVSSIPGEDETCPWSLLPVHTARTSCDSVSDGSLLPPCPNVWPQSASLVYAGWNCWGTWRWCFFPGAPFKYRKLQEQLSSSTLTVTLTACGVTPACQKAKETPDHAE